MKSEELGEVNKKITLNKEIGQIQYEEILKIKESTEWFLSSNMDRFFRKSMFSNTS